MPAFWSSVRLNRSDLDVVPLGLASAYGIPGRDVERSFERGVNFFYWGSYRTPEFGAALRRVRDKTKLQSRGMGVVDRLVKLVSGFGFRSTSGLGQPAGGGGRPSAP